MSDLITNLNSILSTKLEIKDILKTESDVFSDYPAYIEAAIAAFRKNEDRETLEALADVIDLRMEERGHLIMPVEDGVEEGNIIPRTITTDDGETVIAAFTNYEEMKKGPYSEMLSLRIEHLFEAAKELEHVGGIVINPWGQFMYVGKDLISIIEERVNLLEDEDDDGEIQVEIVEISIACFLKVVFGVCK